MNKDCIEGYKIFNSNFTNRYGKIFKEGVLYKTSNNVKFGNDGKGFHLCTNLEDTFRYIDTSQGFQIARVIGSGKKELYNDEYYGYYDMYSCEKIYIKKFLKRKEVINIILKSSRKSIIRFLETCKLTEEEKISFVNQFINDIEILKYILYYQYNQKDAFSIRIKNPKQLIKKYL